LNAPKIVKNGIKLRELWAPKVKGVKNSKKIPLNGTKASSQTPKKFLVCYSIVIKVPDILYNFRWHSYNILNHLK
jgi:hypothetical protein